MTNPNIHPVRIAFRARPPAPRPGVILDLVRHEANDERPEFWTVRAYRDNLNSLNLSGEHMMVVHKWISDIMIQLRAVEPNTFFEIHDRIPREAL